MSALFTSVESLCNRLRQSRLLSAAQVRGVYQEWRRREPRGAAGEVDRFARWLATNRHLTGFQARQLALGLGDNLLLNHYKLLDQAGTGRMAGIYKAAHVSGHIVAIKVLSPELVQDKALLKRFRREARMAVRLKHANIVRTFHLGQCAGRYYLVMEHLEGETLGDVLQRRKKLPPPEAVRLIQQVLLGVYYIHLDEMVHRDLKPDNLMLVPPRPPGTPDNTLHATVKILDIGLGRFLTGGASAEQESSLLTTDGMMLGTAEYMSPEQARNPRTVDGRADIYSLGCLLYHLLAGQPPYTDKNPVSLIIKHATETPRPIRELEPAVPPGLQAIVQTMLAKDPDQRYPTAELAAKALQGFIGAERDQLPAARALGQSYLKWVESQPIEETGAAPPTQDRWYYRHQGARCGPVSSAQLDKLAAAGSLVPDDLLWMEGDDPALGIHARAAVDFATVARQARGATQHKPAAHTTAALPADSGFDPQTGRILDPARFRKWQQEQKRKRDEETAAQPTIQEVFFKARNDLSSWLDLDRNRPLILTGDMDAVRLDPSIQRFMLAQQRYGEEILHKLWHHLEFMIENRRKYFYALGR